MDSVKTITQALRSIERYEEIPLAWRQDTRKGVVSALKTWTKQQEVKQQRLQAFQQLKAIDKSLYKQGFQFVGGIDEVGRGCLAGPVLAACVIMPEHSQLLGINDSKQLSRQKREHYYDLIMKEAIAVGIGIVEPGVIDTINIYEATKVAMQSALDQMTVQPDYLLIDAMTLSNQLPQQALIKGDATSYCIACASIVAKVTRDKLMCQYAEQYSHYGFEQNAGYGTKEHLNGLQQFGITPIHRLTFEPIKSMLR